MGVTGYTVPATLRVATLADVSHIEKPVGIIENFPIYLRKILSKLAVSKCHRPHPGHPCKGS
jgi:hypothetical protein